jgi:S1-C subfamily serine protease
MGYYNFATSVAKQILWESRVVVLQTNLIEWFESRNRMTSMLPLLINLLLCLNQLETSPSTVLLLGKVEDFVLQGSGVVIDANEGLIITAFHLLQRSTDWAVMTPLEKDGKICTQPSEYHKLFREGKAKPVTLIWAEPKLDLAMVKVQQRLTSSRLAVMSKNTIKRDSKLFADGHPLPSDRVWDRVSGQFKKTVSEKWTWGTGQTVQAKMIVIEFAVPLESGFSGGPVWNENQELQGIIIATPKGDKIAYAIDRDELIGFIERGRWIETKKRRIQQSVCWIRKVLQ